MRTETRKRGMSGPELKYFNPDLNSQRHAEAQHTQARYIILVFYIRNLNRETLVRPSFY
jgi:hypothetical protein